MTELALPDEFIERFLLNSAVLLILLRFVYYRFSANRDSLFGFFLFGHGVYVLSSLMHEVTISMGFAFGLFAVLSMLRYRTESISIRDMTYLFIVIVLSLLAGVGPVSIIYLAVISAVMCLIVTLSETTIFAPKTEIKSVLYDNTVNILPENHQALIADLQKRLGCNIVAVKVGSVDFLKDTADLSITVAADALDQKIQNKRYLSGDNSSQ